MESPNYKTSDAGLNIIKSYEKLMLDAYICPAGKLTIGYGHVVLPSEDLKTITEEQADYLLQKDVGIAEKCINSSVKSDISQNQFDALVSLVFNIGCTAFKNSTLLNLINKSDFKGAAEQFDRWVFDKGNKLNGLVSRRKTEKQLFLQVN